MTIKEIFKYYKRAIKDCKSEFKILFKYFPRGFCFPGKG